MWYPVWAGDFLGQTVVFQWSIVVSLTLTANHWGAFMEAEDGMLANWFIERDKMMQFSKLLSLRDLMEDLRKSEYNFSNTINIKSYLLY